MISPVEVYRALTNPDQLGRLLAEFFNGWLGYALLAGVVFSETGLLVGFFLPGDSLLFTIGVVAGLGHLSLPAIIAALSVACIIGDNVGYFLGTQAGESIFRRKDGLLFKQDYVRQTQAFFAKHGGKAIIYARFVPIVRTFTPFMAGVGRMPYARFLFVSLFGGIGWVILMTVLGYTLGNIPLVRQHFEKVILLIVFVSIAPLLLKFLQSRRERASAVVSSR